jgi:hypothetical protein
MIRHFFSLLREPINVLGLSGKVAVRIFELDRLFQPRAAEDVFSRPRYQVVPAVVRVVQGVPRADISELRRRAIGFKISKKILEGLRTSSRRLAPLHEWLRRQLVNVKSSIKRVNVLLPFRWPNSKRRHVKNTGIIDL